MFESVLIANRGEIACRIIRTCRRLGIRAIAVYSDADRDALHVRAADEAARIGPPAAAESYLVAERIVEAALRTGAAAVHPGYGFLAESASFARSVRAAGLVFVGPSAEAMERMGAKDSAKAVMAAAGVPVVEGYQGDDQSASRLGDAAAGVGYPVLIKAAAGGGGRGMRRVDEPGGFDDALAACRREAMAAFGDDRMLVEKVIERPRHIEVQVFGDRFGGAVHLFERDCTLQRRHQKVIEEAPAAGISPELRQALGAAAVKAAQAVAYENAGTVEFLVGPDGGFHFIEMNTRLQVEHPVTEAITGQDLVAWQLQIAAGEPLPLRQQQIAITGHAIEARLYAEDPARGFLPSTGPLTRLRLPAACPGTRVETGVAEGDVVTPFYDPMLAKIVVHGADRPQALARLGRALAATEVQGPITNLAFLATITAAEPFRTLRLDTGWLDREGGALTEAAATPEPLDYRLAALAVVHERAARSLAAARAGGDAASPWHAATGWRLNAPHRQWVRFAASEGELAVAVDSLAGGFATDGAPCRAGRDDEDACWAELDGARLRYRARIGAEAVTLTRAGRRVALPLASAAGRAEAEASGGGLVVATMPGKVTQVLVTVGASVAPGQPLAILEAMKMEHRCLAPGAGTVAAIHVAEGEQVAEGTVLMDLEPAT